VNDEIDEKKAAKWQEGGIEKVKIRFVLTCAARGVRVRALLRARFSRPVGFESGRRWRHRAQSIGSRHPAHDAHVPHRRTASRVSEQNTLDAKHAGSVHYQGPAGVETHHKAEGGGGQMIVMNRNGFR